MVAHRTQGDIGRRMARRRELGHSPTQSMHCVCIRLLAMFAFDPRLGQVCLTFAGKSATRCGCSIRCRLFLELLVVLLVSQVDNLPSLELIDCEPLPGLTGTNQRCVAEF